MSKDLAILSSHLSTLIEARSVAQSDLEPLVAYAISETQDDRTQDTRRAQWEYLLKTEVFKLAVGFTTTSIMYERVVLKQSGICRPPRVMR